MRVRLPLDDGCGYALDLTDAASKTFAPQRAAASLQVCGRHVPLAPVAGNPWGARPSAPRPVALPTMALTRLSRRASIWEVSVRTRQPPRVSVGSSTIVQARSTLGVARRSRTTAASSGCRCTRMSRAATGSRPHCLADDRHDLARVGLKLAARELFANREGEQHQLFLDFAIELLERPCEHRAQRVEARDQCVRLGQFGLRLGLRRRKPGLVAACMLGFDT